MKLNIERSIFLRSLNHIQGVAEKRTTVPILANIRLEAMVGELSLQVTDMDIEVVEVVSCDVEDVGRATAPAHTLYDIVRKLPEGTKVNLEYSPASEELILSSNRARFVLKCLPVSDFPTMTDSTLPFSFILKAFDLHTLMGRTRFAMSTDETRYYLNGVYLHATRSNGDEILRAVATDGHRLARMEVPLPSGASGMPGVIIPRKTVEELRTLTEGVATDIAVSLSDTKIRFAFDGAILTSKLIGGTFPDYERVIPLNNDKIMKVNTKLLAEAVSRVLTVIATDKARAVKLDISKGGLVLSASNAATADNAIDEIEVLYDSPSLSIGFNGRYLLDVLAQMAGDSVHFVMLDSSSPIVVQEITNRAAVYVLMPMRV